MKKLILLPVLLIGVLATNLFAGNGHDKEVQKAFELRMNGKVDEAKALLENILLKDSTDALAYYEKARQQHYLLTGGSEMNMDKILAPINKAVSLEPKNVSFAYYKAIASFLNAFMAMQMGKGEVKNKIAETCTQFENVLSLKPDYYEASLYLIEIYGMLPKDMGGDSLKALDYAKKLESANAYFGAKAKADLAPETTDPIKFWQEQLAKDKKNPEILMELGRACLYKDDPVNAEKYFDEAIKSDPSKNILILDLARYHMMKAMQNKDLVNSELPKAKTFLKKYLQSAPEQIIPLRAYALGLLTRCEMMLGNKAESEKLMEDAKKLDPYFSRASGIPTLLLFDSPTQISRHFFSFFKPF
jgi:tetratricopeptide (TPR) repeat protein